MKTNIIRINTNELREKIEQYEIIYNEKVYLFMSRETMECIKNTILSKTPKMYSYTDAVAMYEGHNVYIDNDLKLGEVEIR